MVYIGVLLFYPGFITDNWPYHNRAYLNYYIMNVLHIEKSFSDGVKTDFGSGSQVHRRITTALAFHRRFRLTQCALDDAFYIALPCLLGYGEAIFILSSYASIKMHEAIAMPVFLVMPFLALFVLAIIIGLFTLGTEIFEMSNKCVIKMNQLQMVQCNSLQKKEVKAEKPYKVNCGGAMFSAKKSTKTSYFRCCIEDTITACLLF